MTQEPERTAVYRVFGEERLLLYIGMTNSVPIRWNGHEAVQPWWEELRSLTVEWYETREEADAAEKAAILAEQPKYNVTYLKPSLVRRERKRPEPTPVDWAAVALERRDDDEDLLNMEDLTRMLRLNSATTTLNALKRTAGPKGFTIGSQQLFRKGEIRRWIAAIEASHQAPASGDAAGSAA
jgi:hypothetical protein